MRFSRYLIASLVLLASAWIIMLQAQSSGPAVNSWSAGSSLSTARSGSCSVTMSDGRVMFAGGTGTNGVLNTVDILGTNGAMTAAPPMLAARSNAGCVALPDGRIFVSGGNDGINALASAEYFTPSTGVWTSAGTMSTPRYGHTPVVDAGGAVLLAGGKTTGGNVSNQLEVFRPANNSFFVMGSLSSARTNYAVTSIDNHRTVFAGGSDGTNTLGTIDIFDAWTNNVVQAGTMVTPRSGFGAATLYDGTVLFTGGIDSTGHVLGTTEIYNPNTQKSVAGPNLNVARGNHQAFALPGNGGVILFGGANAQGSALSSTEIYQPWTGKFTNGAAMNNARSGAANTLMQPGLLITAGGQNAGSYLASTETFAYATVLTDKPDYQPGSVAKFTGSGWQAGETVNLVVTSFPVAGSPTTTEFTTTAVANGAGQFSISGFDIDKSHLGMRFLLTATGSASQAQQTFTDSDNITLTYGTNNSAAPFYNNGQIAQCGPAQPPACTLAYGQSMTINFNILDLTTPANTGSIDGAVTIFDNNISLYGSFLSPCSSCTAANGPTGTFSVSTNDPHGILSPGTNFFTLQEPAGSNGGVTWNASAVVSIQLAVQTQNTSTNITSLAQNTTYGVPVTLTATVSALPDPSTNQTFSLGPQGTVEFKDQSGDLCDAVVTAIAYNTTSVFSCQTPVNLPIGQHQFTAQYKGIPGVWNSTASEAAGLQGTTIVDVNVLAVSTNTTFTVSPAGSPQVYPRIAVTR